MAKKGRPRKRDKKGEVLSLRLSKDYMDALERICKKEKTTPAEVIRGFIKKRVITGDEIHQKLSDILKELTNEDNIILSMLLTGSNKGKSIDGILPLTDKAKKEIIEIWYLIEDIITECINGIIGKFSVYGLDKLSFELGDYIGFFYVIPETGFTLVVITTNYIDERLIKRKLEKKRIKIIELFERYAM